MCIRDSHKIDHVAEIKFAGLRNVVNSLGTIDLCYDRTVSALTADLIGLQDATA